MFTFQIRTHNSSGAARVASTIVAAMLAASILSGCAGKPEPPPTRLDVEVNAAPDINPDIDGTPSPVVLRVYELASDGSFLRAGFFALFDNDQAALGQDLKAREEMVLKPGQEVKVEKTCKQGTTFVGVIAAFQDIDHATWRAVQPVAEHETNAFSIDVRRLSVAIKGRKKD